MSILIAIKDLKEQLVNIDEDILDSQLVFGTLDGFPDSYQGFATTLRLVTMAMPSIIHLMSWLHFYCMKSRETLIENAF